MTKKKLIMHVIATIPGIPALILSLNMCWYAITTHGFLPEFTNNLDLSRMVVWCISLAATTAAQMGVTWNMK